MESAINHSIGTMAQRTNLVPDGLLALAKDTRYVKECQALFLHVLSSFLPRRRYQLLEQESWILASLLCLALGLKHTSKGTTLGMETVGLQFPSSARSSRWKLVLATLTSLSWAYAFSPARTATAAAASNHNNEINENNNNNSHQDVQGSSLPILAAPRQNDEMLHGSRRREFHERQRAAMLERANRAAGNQLSSNTSGAGSSASPFPENLQGARAVATQRSRGRYFLAELASKIKSLLLQLAKVLSAAALSPYEGPHTLITDTHHHQQQQQHDNQNHQITVQQAGRWLAKLQLAHFCLTGMYPTWMHRLSGHPFIAGDSERLYHRPTTARLVGVLIGAQALGAFVQASTAAMSHFLVQYEQRQASSSSSSPRATPSTPPIVFHPPEVCASTSISSGTTGNRCLCSICKMDRTYPAAPSSCGHVFCWSCLIQWTSAVRPGCPICRSSCRPQDIVALFNYTPTTK